MFGVRCLVFGVWCWLLVLCCVFCVFVLCVLCCLVFVVGGRLVCFGYLGFIKATLSIAHEFLGGNTWRSGLQILLQVGSHLKPT